MNRKFGAISGLLASYEWPQQRSRRGHQRRANDAIIFGQNSYVAKEAHPPRGDCTPAQLICAPLHPASKRVMKIFGL
jgi:hypothetical protein